MDHGLEARATKGYRIGYQAGTAGMDDTPSRRNESLPGDAWQAAIDYGIDVHQLEYLLTLTPAERLQRHEQALVLVRAMREAGIRYYGFDPRLAETPERPSR